MMHPNFYHWHNRAELKPETSILQARWDAAAKFAEELTAEDACSILRLALFSTATPEFAKRFSEALVAVEPTFLPERNTELLRVMATAALYNNMETNSDEADAVALGLLAAAFQPDRIQPLCKELPQRATEYLATEAERVRPTPSVGGKFQELKTAVDAEEWEGNPTATQLIGDAVVELGETMGRIAEENQFVWWLLGRHSSRLNMRRDELEPKKYALICAAEAAVRVALLPPPASVESLIGEVLAHCSKQSNESVLLIDIINAANIDCLEDMGTRAGVHEICPITSLLGVLRTEGKVHATSLKKINIHTKLKVSPDEASNQYFRELMFLRALAQLG